MHRFYLPSEISGSNSLLLEGGEAHHAARVLRIRPGEQVEVLNGRGVRSLCAVETVTKQRVDLTVLHCSTQPRPSCEVSLFQAVTRGKSMDTIVQKATELGVSRIQPVMTERVEVKLNDQAAEARADKWRQVAIEALKQCGGVWLPQITPPISLDTILTSSSLPEFSVVGALTKPAALPGRRLSEFEEHNGRLPASIGIWIGPEGDFTPSEIASLSQLGIQPVTFGSQVLRSETAAIYCLSVFNHELQLRHPQQPT